MRASPQQAAAVEFVRSGRGSAIVESVAGSGKTTLLRMIARELTGSAVVCAFNKAIADELTSKLASDGCGRNVKAATFHSLGFGAWRRVAPGVRVDKDKMTGIVDGMGCPDSIRAFTLKLVSLAKQSAVGLLWDIDNDAGWYAMIDRHDLQDALAEDIDLSEGEALAQGVAMARRAVKRSMQLDTEAVDFDDMIFAPLVHGARMWQNDWVLIDEAQDTNPARRALAKKMLKPGGRLIAVGDPHQAIYGFTGADNDALDIIAREFSCIRMPLTVTFRCPKRVVAHARNWVSHIEAHEANPEGEVRTIDELGFMATLDQLRPGDAILCRNTKPIVELAFGLIRRRIRCHVEGRDIGAGLLALVGKWRRVKTVGGLRERLIAHLERQVERMMARGQEERAASLTDRVETLLVIMESMPDDEPVEEVRRVVGSLFADTQPGDASDVTLSTVHKAKGREWGRVYLWGRNRYMPSPFARQDWQVEQEDNLIYVAVTRAMRELIEVVVETPKGKRG